MTATTPAIDTSALFGKRKRRSRRPWIAVVLLAGIGVAGWQIALRATATADKPTLTTVAITRGDVIEQVTATGTLSPVVTVEVGSQVSGRITALNADYNSAVKAGQVIALIDPQGFESAVAQAKARLSAAHADYARAKAVAANSATQYQRAKSLAAGGAVSQAEADDALTAKRSADASKNASWSSVTLAKAALDQAKLDLSYTTIKSPIDGVVVSRSVDVGQTVAASLSAPTLFVIAEDLRKMEVHTNVAEADVGKLTEGMAVEFTVDAYPDDKFNGTVKQVRYEATTVSSVVTYDAVVEVANDELKLRPGMTANASFIVNASRGVFVVPNKALTYRPANAAELRKKRRAAAGANSARPAGPQGGAGARQPRAGRPAGARPTNRRMVWLLRDGAPTPVRVKLGLTDGLTTEITAVTEGDITDGDLAITSDGSPAAARTQRPAGAAGTTPRRSGRRGPPRVL